jgi:hypothetical protein
MDGLGILVCLTAAILASVRTAGWVMDRAATAWGATAGILVTTLAGWGTGMITGILIQTLWGKITKIMRAMEE